MNATSRRRTALLALLLAPAACDRATPVQGTDAPPGGDGLAVVRLDCAADVAAPALRCGGADALPGEGVASVVTTVGGQGVYVRLASSNVTFDGGVFGMDVTVQNLSSLPFATVDGAARDGRGVRVFFAGDPVPVGGTGEVAVANPTGTAFFTAAGQPYFQYGGTLGASEGAELGGDGILSSAERSAPRRWEFHLSGGATRFTFTVYVQTHTPPGTLASVAPRVTSVSPATLVPGGTAVLSGANFRPTAGQNEVTIGGVPAPVLSAGPESLEVLVPCMRSGTVGVAATHTGMTGRGVVLPLQARRHALVPGEAVVLPAASEAGCNELAPTGEDARYVVAVYNVQGSPAANAPFVVRGDAWEGAPASGRMRAEPVLAAVSTRGAPDEGAHGRLLERNVAELERLRARFARDPRMRPRRSLAAAVPVEPPLARTIRLPDANSPSFCDHYTQVNATRVYYAGRVAIYEDADNTPPALRASANPVMQAYYDRIGDQYNADMEPVVRESFGDPLRRDGETDSNGVLVAFFTPIINHEMPGYAGFIVSCDQFPNDSLDASPSNRSSNFGEYFYAYQPTATGTGYAAFTPDSWYWSIRATFIHETKHVASFAARVANGAPIEASWLEEGTARHAEELWARGTVYGVPWKGNTGYGSAAAPGSVYCDYRRDASVAGGSACLATHPSRPSLNVYRHMSGLYNFMVNGPFYSAFGSTPDDGGSFYATSWSLARYAIDRYGASDGAFLTALTQSSATGTANLAARAGVPFERLMGEWALALAMDDWPGMPVGASTPRMPTWNLRDIYAGLEADPLFSFSRAWPIRYTGTFTLGAVAPLAVPTLRGGGVAWFELSGAHTAPQLIQLTGGSVAAPGPLPGTVRVAIGRVE